ALTWVATANAVESLGAKPVFCDIDLRTFNIIPDAIEVSITPRTKAIIPVHLFGLSARIEQIIEIARKYNLLVIEDAACGFAAKYKGKHVGGFGHAGCFSFHLPDFPYLGFNYRLTDIQAAIGASQMDRAAEIHTKREAWANKYDTFLSGLDWLEKPFRDEDYTHGFQAYVCLFRPQPPSLENLNELNRQRNEFMDYLQARGISTRPGTHAVHLL
ncbi:MAG: DegT/DnrJ/EryC1/StrS family aminotransferase, partial [Acidobacteriota bacterium]|nr:DegT/DnrJ/EryC1/StrS family aminotransferase [Acidobacteriota bacterium]